jgi:hypothetical protein
MISSARRDIEILLQASERAHGDCGAVITARKDLCAADSE